MNLPNAITVGRFLLTLVFFGILSYVLKYGEGRETVLLAVALGVFLLAALSDMVDGAIARRQGLETGFGRFADPFVDKIMVCGAYVFLANMDNPPLEFWMPVGIITREFGVTAIRSFMEARGVPFGASFEGKVKMVLQCLNIVVLLVYFAFLAGRPLPFLIALNLTAVVVIYTLVTGLIYVIIARQRFSRRQPEKPDA